MAAQKGIDLRWDISGEIGAIETDQRRLEQILLNLINNAVKFTDKGHVGLSCRRENGQYVLSVSDTGIGIRRKTWTAFSSRFTRSIPDWRANMKGPASACPSARNFWIS
jgi:signal transduction histidine kinase